MFNGYTNSKELLTELYVVQKMAISDIGEKLGIAKEVVKAELVRLEIPIRSKGRPRFLENIKLKLCSCATFATMSITRRAMK